MTVLVLGLLSFAPLLFVICLACSWCVETERETGNTFIDSVTHELKSPLASLKLAVETLSREDVPATTQDDLRRMMLGDISRLDLFIDDILAASRLSDRSNRADQVEINVVELLQETRDICQERHNLAEEQLVLDCALSHVVKSDRVALTTVFTNLLENAVKYSRKADGTVPTIHVSLTSLDKWLQIQVIDQGIGLERQFRKSVFERFFRVPSEDVRSRHGSGLGLFVVSEIVRNMGGRIEMDSPGVGHGTTVTLRLPMT